MFSRRYPTIGGDPEFFIVKTIDGKGRRVNEIMSADKFLPPKNKKDKISAGEVFFDGVQAEINPNFSSCRETFLSNVQICLAEVFRNVVEKRDGNPELEGRYNFWTLASVDITKDTIKNTDLECRRFGCSPDFNVYTDKKIRYPDGNKFFIRFAGGHIHLGFPTIEDMKNMKTPEKLERLIKMLDALVGVFSVAIAGNDTIEAERIRRQYYGKAGTYRLNGHGLEYRVLSSFWLSSPYLASLILSIARDAYIFVFNGLDTEFFEDIEVEEVRKIIDTVWKERAIKFYKDHIKPFYAKLREDLIESYGDDEIEDFLSSPLLCANYEEPFNDLMNEGYEKFFNPRKVLQNWSISRGVISPDGKGIDIYESDWSPEEGFATYITETYDLYPDTWYE